MKADSISKGIAPLPPHELEAVVSRVPVPTLALHGSVCVRVQRPVHRIVFRITTAYSVQDIYYFDVIVKYMRPAPGHIDGAWPRPWAVTSRTARYGTHFFVCGLSVRGCAGAAAARGPWRVLYLG